MKTAKLKQIILDRIPNYPVEQLSLEQIQFLADYLVKNPSSKNESWKQDKELVDCFEKQKQEIVKQFQS